MMFGRFDQADNVKPNNLIARIGKSQAVRIAEKSGDAGHERRVVGLIRRLVMVLNEQNLAVRI